MKRRAKQEKRKKKDKSEKNKKERETGVNGVLTSRFNQSLALILGTK